MITGCILLCIAVFDYSTRMQLQSHMLLMFICHLHYYYDFDFANHVRKYVIVKVSHPTPSLLFI
jgi:hypothetical protein